MTATRTIDSVTARDGTRIHIADWGHGAPVVFSHGWPLSGDAWEDQMLFLANHGYRVIAHDRRGHGRSSQPWHGNDMDTYADDLATVLDTLDLTGATLVGHSTGGGEVARYIGRHGTGRVAKAVLVGAVTPQMMVSPNNPEGVPMEVFDGIRAGVQADRAQFFLDLTMPFFGFNRDGAKVSEGMRQSFLRQGLQCSIKSAYACIKQFSETDFSEDLKKMTVPTLVVHGDDDQIVPIATTARRAVELLPQGRLSVYEGAGHGLPLTHKDKLNAELLAFLRG
ncbi:alpha/beta hydrolase [Massilia sp. YIM B02769]|uniref:alpha/beta fold hydrolase n=1 Tax=Massilia sp. YIM B02769 TaxID=3050129 RepID=UPI0025B73406|nr:alpha/beta hydrolase [Massilia sp. YIM B02769]MDN4058670.1 alpha/beta hydrolase [Massilia sp. YIM B02769]